MHRGRGSNQIDCAEECSNLSSSAHLGEGSIGTTELAEDQVTIPEALHHCQCWLGWSSLRLWQLPVSGLIDVIDEVDAAILRICPLLPARWESSLMVGNFGWHFPVSSL